MIVSNPNDVKIYHLSAGKSLPEWLSEYKRRSLQKNDIHLRKRIELIQDFEMPVLSTTVKVTPDGNYIYATGIYKPRVRCYDVNNLSMKFERCLDSEVITFEILSDDYKKLVFLRCDRYIEFHTPFGRHYELRIPKFGRDMRYHSDTCDLYFVGAGSEVYRLNLEQGQFLNPLVTEASEINKCVINPAHQLICFGTVEGKIEGWDPRTRARVAILDCMPSLVEKEMQLENVPSVTALQFQGALTLAVGTATGQVLLYDIRGNKPFLIKDHMYGLPIHDIEFQNQQDFVLSMDNSVIKIWEKHTGKIFTAIEANANFNGMCLVPNTGLIFAANEDKKIQSFFIPSMGEAPKWCSFLDSLTEEMEETQVDTIYDDYKFVTKKELEELGLDHLLGTNILRAYMHGYFLNARLHRKATLAIKPFAFDAYKKKKIREKIEETRGNRVKFQKLPKVNRELALKLIDEERKGSSSKKKKKAALSLLKDERFKALFENPDFQVDKSAEEYRLLNPVLSKLDKNRQKELKKMMSTQFEQVEDDAENGDTSSSSESSSDDDQTWTKEVKLQHKLLRKEKQEAYRSEMSIEEEKQLVEQPKFFELKEGEEFKGLKGTIKIKRNNASLGERVEEEGKEKVTLLGAIGSREMTFSTIKKDRRREKEEQNRRKHFEERRKVFRSTKNLTGRHSKKSF